MRTEESTGGRLPLSGVTVVDLTQVVAGPFATMTLADLGADVVKIEAVGRGDRSRSIQPVPEYFDTINRNKRSVTLNLKDERGQQVALDLLADADVFVESTKPGRIDRYGLDYETVREVNPDIVYCTITGFGTDSPYQDLPAWDMLIQGMSGIMSMTGEPDRTPLWSGLPSGDLIAGSYAVQSVLAALYARERGDIEGEWVEVPMFDAAVSWLTSRAGYTFGTDEPFPRHGTHHPSIAPFGLFDAVDGTVVVAAGTGSLWEALCAAVDRPDLAEDDRFATMDDRVENRTELLAALEPVFADYEVAELVARLREHDVPAGPIHDTASVWEDEHVRERNLRRTMEREGRPDAEVIDHPVHFTNLVTDLGTPPEELGESTDDVLSDLGYDPETVDDLRRDGVVD
ncbi:CaiB/BaiF CoA transferase family protein [Halomarina litorea]|uniref:CaiB/BaiF CoA transferase family protein n=1 Tax=Halomarina litorea TaxID=2961595 RepID=UPI0020C43150|nr:CaiB/BaiF CoA-transferase family protein [Halomarina sp. BCD28]